MVTRQRILVVDDELAMVKIIRYSLELEGFEVAVAGDIASARRIFDEFEPDLVTLDVMLPGGSGLEFSHELRLRSSVPIVIVSARCDEVDRIIGLESGADDYVAKPFSPRELVTRVKTILRRSGTQST